MAGRTSLRVLLADEDIGRRVRVAELISLAGGVAVGEPGDAALAFVAADAARLDVIKACSALGIRVMFAVSFTVSQPA